MNEYELYKLVEDYYGYKIDMRSVNSKTKEVEGMLYDAFILRCGINDIQDSFSAGIVIGKDQVITEFFGIKALSDKDEESIKHCLNILDDYCRLRLPDKYLDAYYEAYASLEDKI